MVTLQPSLSKEGNHHDRSMSASHWNNFPNSRIPSHVPSPPPRHPIAKNTQHPGEQHIDTGLSDREEARQRINGNIAFACFVFWCCNVFFGTIAFFVAISSKDATAKEARRLGNLTLVISVIGIVVSWILVGVIVALWWYGLLNISFAPWRISHYYPDEKSI
ncbi:hypothetical protein LSH36_708g01083 [Paralvinella palmiformis]|uniref:Interferon-induced transmembrane protein n=1 Tax=Paralvinella palmiformis TaxID=53620 RepID=A0AAD9J3M9_9ANNE|nr:hypothetical protein LSH36_708g01083 [Paralvinella palmiformis]